MLRILIHFETDKYIEPSCNRLPTLIETQDRHLEGSKTALTPPYILIADQYCLQITVPISAIYYPIMSYYLHLLRVYIEALELHSQSSRLCFYPHSKAYTLASLLLNITTYWNIFFPFFLLTAFLLIDYN